MPSAAIWKVERQVWLTAIAREVEEAMRCTKLERTRREKALGVRLKRLSVSLQAGSLRSFRSRLRTTSTAN